MATTSNFFTNENPKTVVNSSGNYGVIPHSIDTTSINDGVTERGSGLGKLGSSMPSPMARLFLFSAALRQVNNDESVNPGQGHIGTPDNTGKLIPTPYHDLVGELLDMLEFIFKYGDEIDFHVVKWDLTPACQALNNSNDPAHHQLASALTAAFSQSVLQQQSIYLFKWKDEVIGGSSPISLVYTSPNVRQAIAKLGCRFTGDASNELFTDSPLPLHERDEAFQEYLCRLRYTDLPAATQQAPIAMLTQYIMDSMANYTPHIDRRVNPDPKAYSKVKNLMSQGHNVKVNGVQLRMSDHSINISPQTSDYILKPTVDFYQHGNPATPIPMILTKYGDDRLIYAAGRKWNSDSDRIDKVPHADIYNRHLPGFGSKVKYPYLTASDFFEDKVIEVSYEIDRSKFFTGSKQEIQFLLPLKKVFFDYFKVSDLVDNNGAYTDMLSMKYDEDHSRLTVILNLPLVNGHTISLQRTYNTEAGSNEKLDCYDVSKTFDFAIFPFYRLEPDTDRNVYNVMLGKTVNEIGMKFFEPRPTPPGVSAEVTADCYSRTKKNEKSSIATDHIRINAPFSFIELSVPDTKNVHALVIPIFTKVDSNPANASDEYVFSLDFGTTNTHVAYVKAPHDQPFGHNHVETFNYDEQDPQMVTFNNKEGAREFSSFTTTLKRELVPPTLGKTLKFPMRTATYQVKGNPGVLKMFFNTNIGFNYSDDISHSNDYKTNIKWDRYDGKANQRMSTYFAQMLWMMKNKSVLNNCSDTFRLVVTYPISMRPNDLTTFREAWNKAIQEVKCNVDLKYRTESVAPYYSYLANLSYGEPYANMDIGGGTSDILYVNPNSHEASVFSAFFAANDLWNDGIDQVNCAYKANGFLKFYSEVQGNLLGDRRTDFESVQKCASSSADVISYLFANDSWTQFSDTLRCSTVMMQLPVIHFSAQIFYLAYAMYMGMFDVPVNLSFTGMGSKYIKLISNAESDISRLVNAIFHYAGREDVLNYSDLSRSGIEVSFAPNPKEVTATGALISLNYNKHINPSEDLFYGYHNEDPETTLRYQNISSNEMKDAVNTLFRKFTAMFKNEEVLDVLSDIGYNIDPKVIEKLNKYGMPSFQQMLDISSSDKPQGSEKIKEPMFFWPLKNSLYLIGKELADEAIQMAKSHS